MKVREPICIFPFLMLTMRCDQYIPASAMYGISSGKIIRNYYGSVFGNDPPLWCSTTALVEPKSKWITVWLHQAIIRPVSRRSVVHMVPDHIQQLTLNSAASVPNSTSCWTTSWQLGKRCAGHSGLKKIVSEMVSGKS